MSSMIITSGTHPVVRPRPNISNLRRLGGLLDLRLTAADVGCQSARESDEMPDARSMLAHRTWSRWSLTEVAGSDRPDMWSTLSDVSVSRATCSRKVASAWHCAGALGPDALMPTVAGIAVRDPAGTPWPWYGHTGTPFASLSSKGTCSTVLVRAGSVLRQVGKEVSAAYLGQRLDPFTTPVATATLCAWFI